MSENSPASHTEASAPTDEPDATRTAAGDSAGASVAPDMAPIAGAFDTMTAAQDDAIAADGTTATDDAGVGQAGDDVAADDAPAARSGLLARIPGERRHWMLAGMVTGGILLGGLASGGIAWKMISSRDAEVQARTAKLDLQSSRLAEQEARIEVLTRAVNERPLPDEAAAARAAEPPPLPAKDAQQPSPAAKAVEPPPPPPSVAKAAEAPRPLPKAAEAPAPIGEPSPPTGAASGVAPSVAGSGVCDVPGGADASAQMRRCIEWFAGRSKPPAKPAP